MCKLYQIHVYKSTVGRTEGRYGRRLRLKRPRLCFSQLFAANIAQQETAVPPTNRPRTHPRWSYENTLGPTTPLRPASAARSSGESPSAVTTEKIRMVLGAPIAFSRYK